MPSSVRSARDSSLRIRVAPPDVTIDDWPLRDRPLASSLVMTIAAAIVWLAVWATGSVAAGILAGVSMAIITWRTWLPARYEIGGSGITQSVWGWRRRIPWSAIRRCEIRNDGVLLLPDEIPTPLGPLRGLYLHWGGRREPIVAQLEYHLPSWTNSRDSARGETTEKG
jgi:hypothetical protein